MLQHIIERLLQFTAIRTKGENDYNAKAGAILRWCGV